ncbi:hypothetical protein [Vibrio splendidus]|jgi:hypothetical protein|uniref:hypothetical protein n=1 Tax=Vibrio splendidus TaxID=29497 RepID=UPI0006CA4EEF|nr:hypothetical protein [Vibrio splendidus]KPL99504.1 hypothetical protein AN167_12605 [Vibrio splendidus]
MTVTEKLLAALLERGVFDNEEQKVGGIAQLAIDTSFDSLSHAQKYVLSPWLSQHCTGSTDPGGYHNDCSAELDGDDLLEAIELADDVECLQCDSCRNEDSNYAHQYEKLMAE